MGSRRSGAGRSRPLGGVSGPQQLEERDGRSYYCRPIPGQNAAKSYVCPRCGGPIGAGQPHVVVWPADEADGIGQRRHWHTRCWRSGAGRAG